MSDTPMWSDPEKMWKACEEYFDKCDAGTKTIVVNTKDGPQLQVVPHPIPYTVPGLSYHLGFASRQSFWEYGQKERFAYTINRARARIEGQRAGHLVDPDTKNSRGIMFDLQNNFGWKDEQNINHGGNVGLNFIVPEKLDV